LAREHSFRLAEKADALVTRDAGKRMRGELLALYTTLGPDELIKIAVTGVDVLTPSFVDECLGRLVSEVGITDFRARFRIEGADADWKTMINAVVQNRLLLDRRTGAKPPATSGEGH
jgi:hypothetical protein